MKGHVIVVSGTGTGVGKTHVGAALLRAWASRGLAVCGYKPVETGVAGDEGADIRALRLASSFHVKPAARSTTYRDPISPHLAARLEGRAIDIFDIASEVSRLRSLAAGVLVELAGGLFSPLTASHTCADVVALLGDSALLIVAPDRIGVLHDVGATWRAARGIGIVPMGVTLTTPEQPDRSTGTNASEISAVCKVPVLAVIPRDPVETLALGQPIAQLLSALTPHR